jgi:hypothetical protein
MLKTVMGEKKIKSKTILFRQQRLSLLQSEDGQVSDLFT